MVTVLQEANRRNASGFEGIPKGQSPALIVLVNDKDLLSGSIVFDQEVILTIKTPETFDCAALLVGTYLVHFIDIPKPYKSLLKILRLMFEDKLVTASQKQGTNDEKAFVRQFANAASTLLAKVCIL